jgi:hypothetical protein
MSRKDPIMPPALTPAIRKAAEGVAPPLTINDPPYLDALWAAMYAAVCAEQGAGERQTSGEALAKHAQDVATRGLANVG